MIDMLIQIFM